jgi:hypothetical protein
MPQAMLTLGLFRLASKVRMARRDRARQPTRGPGQTRRPSPKPPDACLEIDPLLNVPSIRLPGAAPGGQLKLTLLAGERWRAEIEYRSTIGRKEHKAFEGTRAFVRERIRAEKDLPLAECTRFLYALSLHEQLTDFHLIPCDPAEQRRSDSA